MDIHDFCETVFQELRANPSHDVGVTEIRHFKETDNMEHEFLLADIADSEGRKKCTLRLERSAAIPQRTSLFQRMVGVSTSIFPAKDTIWIASSDTQLIDGMERGPSFPVARLSFPQKPFSLRELCLILSFFPAFSPSYKLREEQCYWFCDVVLKTTVVAYEAGASIVKEKGFKKAGRFGRVSVKLSASTRQLFIDAYKAVRTLGEHSGSNTRLPKLPPLEAIPMLLALLEVPSTEARSRAIDTIITLAKFSFAHRSRLVDSEAVPKLASIVTSIPSMIAPGMVALQALVGDLWWQYLVSDSWLGCVVGDSWPQFLNGANMDIKIAYLSLASPYLNIPAGTIHEHVALLLSSNFPTVLVTLLQSSRSSHIQISVATAIEWYLKQVKSFITHDWIVVLSNTLSSPLYSPDMKRRIADFLVAVVQHKTPSKNTLLQANIKGMLTSDSEHLKTLILNSLNGFPHEDVLWKELLSAGCLPILEQLTLARPHHENALYAFSQVCCRFDGIPPYDSRLPEHFIQRLKQGTKSEKSNALIITGKLASSQVFSEVFTRKVPSVLAELRGGIYGRMVAYSVCSLSRWSTCRPALSDTGLIPPDDRSYNSGSGHEVVRAHLRNRFPGWDWTC